MTTTRKRPRSKPDEPIAITEALALVAALEKSALHWQTFNGKRAADLFRAALRIRDAYREAIKTAAHHERLASNANVGRQVAEELKRRAKELEAENKALKARRAAAEKADNPRIVEDTPALRKAIEDAMSYKSTSEEWERLFRRSTQNVDAAREDTQKIAKQLAQEKDRAEQLQKRLDAMQDPSAIAADNAKLRTVTIDLEREIRVARGDAERFAERANHWSEQAEEAGEDAVAWQRYATRCEVLVKHMAEFITEPTPKSR